MDKEKQYRIRDVGIDFTSLRNDRGVITGSCIIYGKENGKDAFDTRPFRYVSDKDIQFATPLDDPFTNEEYEEIFRILAQNIKDNFELLIIAAESLTNKEDI